jgi:hypothetical protein
MNNIDAPPPTQRHCPPPILAPSYLFISLLLQTRLFPAHRVKKRVARETKPLVSDLLCRDGQLSHPRQSDRQTRGHLSALCDSNCRPRVAGAGARRPCASWWWWCARRWRKGIVGRRRPRSCRVLWSAWSFTRNHPLVAGCRLQCGLGPLACMPVSPLKRAGSSPDEMQGAPAEQPQISSANYASGGLKRVS